MKVTLIIYILASITVIATAPTPDVLPYGEKFLGTYHTYGDKVTANLINYEGEITYRLRTKTEVAGVYLEQDSPANEELGQGNNFCTNAIGITLNNGEQTFCNMVLFGWEVETIESDLEYLRLSLVFKYPGFAPFVLDVPIFKVPVEMWENKEALTEWAEANDVAVLSPLDSEKIRTMRKDKQLTLDFAWLNGLVAKGIYTNVVTRISEIPIDASYVSRPLGLPQEVITGLIQLIDELGGGLDTGDSESTELSLHSMRKWLNEKWFSRKVRN